MGYWDDLIGLTEGILQFGIGGPRIRRNGTNLEVRTADNSALAPILASNIGAGSVVTYQAVANIGVGKSGGVYEHREIIPQAGITPSSRINVFLDAHLDSDANDPEMLDILTVGARAGTENFELIFNFSQRTSGPIKICYQVF